MVVWQVTYIPLEASYFDTVKSHWKEAVSRPPQALVLSLYPIDSLQRIRRMVRALQESGFDVSYIAPKSISLNSVTEVLALAPIETLFSKRRFRFNFQRLVKFVIGRFSKQRALEIVSGIVIPHKEIHDAINSPLDLIIVEEIELAPVAFQIQKESGGQVIIELRDYWWEETGFKRMTQPFSRRLYLKYLPMAKKIVCVSPGQQGIIRTTSGVNPRVILSLPDRHILDIKPSLTRLDKRIRIIFHGQCVAKAKLEYVVNAVARLPSRYTLTLIFAGGEEKCKKNLIKLAQNYANISVLEALPYDELIGFSSDFDLGLVFFPPTSLNNRYMLPNKVFEYVQAGLGILTGPNPDIIQVLNEFGCVAQAKGFSESDLFEFLSSIDISYVTELKRCSRLAAREFHSTISIEQWKQVITEAVSSN